MSAIEQNYFRIHYRTEQNFYLHLIIIFQVKSRICINRTVYVCLADVSALNKKKLRLETEIIKKFKMKEVTTEHIIK
jgi:hypothetical protein